MAWIFYARKRGPATGVYRLVKETPKELRVGWSARATYKLRKDEISFKVYNTEDEALAGFEAYKVALRALSTVDLQISQAENRLQNLKSQRKQMVDQINTNFFGG